MTIHSRNPILGSGEGQGHRVVPPWVHWSARQHTASTAMTVRRRAMMTKQGVVCRVHAREVKKCGLRLKKKSNDDKTRCGVQCAREIKKCVVSLKARRLTVHLRPEDMPEELQAAQVNSLVLYHKVMFQEAYIPSSHIKRGVKDLLTTDRLVQQTQGE